MSENWLLPSLYSKLNKENKLTIFSLSTHKEHSQHLQSCKISQHVKYCLSACVWGLTWEAGGSRASRFLAWFKEEEEEEESSRMWPEPWAPAKSTPASPPPTPHRTMAASLLKFHVIGYQAWIFVLAQYPGSGACCRRDTLCKLKLKKLLFSLASERGKKSVTPLSYTKPKKACSAPLAYFLYGKKGRIRTHIE